MSDRRAKRKASATESRRAESDENLIYSLPSLLNQMIFSRHRKAEAYRQYTQLLIEANREVVIEFTMNAIISCFIQNTSGDELVFTHPNSVSSFFVNACREYPWIFEHQLSHESSEKRYRMVLILKSLFSLKIDMPGINIARELMLSDQINIWNEFLRRFTDVEPEIRIACVQTAEVLLKTQIDEQIVQNLQMKLTKRVRDFEPDIRTDTCEAVDRSSERKTQNILSNNLMKHFIARTGDKVADVRRRVLVAVSNVFSAINQKYPETREDFVFMLPSGCLLRYCAEDISLDEKSVIETIFADNLIGASAGDSVRMDNLIKLVCYCTEPAVKSISRILHAQRVMSSGMVKFAAVIGDKDFADSSERSRAKSLAQMCASFAKRFAIDSIETVIMDFYRIFEHNPSKISVIRDVFSGKSESCDESIREMMILFDLEPEFATNDCHIEFKEQLISRCGIGMIDRRSIIALLRLINNYSSIYAQRLTSLIVLLSNLYAEYFRDETVTSELLAMPDLILATIASDSVLPHLNCSQHFKDIIKRSVLERRDK